MRTVTFASLLTAMAALDGGQALTDVTAPVLATWAEYFNMALRYAWNWAEFPELNRVRERTPSSGLITWAESGQPLIGSVYGVTLDDPNTTVNPRGVQWRHDATGLGLRVFNATGNVFVRHTRTSPQLTTAAWAGGTTYAADDLAYSADTGECYESLQDTNLNHAVTDTAWWRKIDLPWIFRTALPRGAYALKTGAGGQKQTEVLLKNSMDGLLAMEIEQFRTRAGQHQSFSVANQS